MIFQTGRKRSNWKIKKNKEK